MDTLSRTGVCRVITRGTLAMVLSLPDFWLSERQNWFMKQREALLKREPASCEYHQ